MAVVAWHRDCSAVIHDGGGRSLWMLMVKVSELGLWSDGVVISI